MEITIDKIKNIDWKSKFSTVVDISICLIVVLAIYFHTLNRPWIFYDERVIYEEIYAPITNNIGEIFEILQSFGLFNNVSSSNNLYSFITVDRTNLLDETHQLLLAHFFKKNPFNYHLFNLLLHLINTSIVFLILKNILRSPANISKIIIILLTLLWALHPVHVESILLSTNIGATFCYSVYFILFFDFVKNRKQNTHIFRKIFLSICFLITMLFNEHIISLPLILFFYSVISSLKSNDLKTTLTNSLKETLPYLIGLMLYLVYFTIFGFILMKLTSLSPVGLTIERLFWLTPQIFIHYLKLIFLPLKLSIDQTAFVTLGKSLFDPYSITCFVSLIFWLFVPFLVFIWKRKLYVICLVTILFFVSLLPYTQIITPSYILAAERYLYIPSFFIVLGIALITSNLYSLPALKKFSNIPILVILIAVLILSTRTYLRTNDWENNSTLLKSTIKSAPNYLYKGARYRTLAETYSTDTDKKDKPETYFKRANIYLYKALEHFKEEKKEQLNPPEITKFYGLDPESQIVKSIYFLSLDAIANKNKDPKKYLKLFAPHLQKLDYFDPRTLELYANLLIRDNNLPEAKKIFLKAYKKYPRSTYILLSLIKIETDFEKNPTNAKKYLEEALRFDPYSKNVLFEAVRHYQHEGNPDEYAKYAYLYGLRTHSKFFYNEALAGYLILGDLKNAKKTIDKLLILDPSDPNTLYLSSNYYIKQNDYKKALEQLNKAHLIIEDGKTDKQLSFNITNTLAKLHATQGNYQLAILHAREALNFAEGDPENIAKVKKLLSDIGV